MNNRLFQGIERGSLEQMLVCANARERGFRAGELIFHQGDRIKNIYIVLKGRVSIYRHLSSGKKNIFYEVGEGEFFGEQYFFYKDQASHDEARSETAVELLEMSWDFFSCFCENGCEHHRQLVQNILEMIFRNEWKMMKKLNITSAVSLRERISIWLLDEAAEENLIRFRMNREELAEYLGVARPSLSRALMRMQEEGLIMVGRKEIRILDREKLESFL